MLLIIFLGVMTKLALVSGDCFVGTEVMKNFNFTKFSGPRPWYWLFYTPNDSDNDLDCPVATYARPVGNISLVTTRVYVISDQSYETLYGNATNWNRTGWKEIYSPPSSITGEAYVIAVDYDSYVILKFCYFQSNQLYVYVGFRSQNPGEATIKNVRYKLGKNNIDFSQLNKYKTDHCQ